MRRRSLFRCRNKVLAVKKDSGYGFPFILNQLSRLYFKCNHPSVIKLPLRTINRENEYKSSSKVEIPCRHYTFGGENTH